VVHKDGHAIWVELQSTIIRDANTGTPQEVIGVVRDITERRRLEDELRQALNKEKELNGLKSQFISIVSHEFRTPLAAIQSSTDLLKRYSERMTEEHRREHLDKAQMQVRRLTDLMDDVLLLNRAQARGIEFNPIALDLELFCRSVVEDMQLLSETHNIQWESDCQVATVNVDPKLVRRALTNLLSNAVKYSASGSTVSVALRCDRQQATLVVRDQGIGIPAADQKHLFEDFYRATNVSTISGSGMGLTIVQQAVKAHNGAITFESEEGKGTTFTLTLPVSAVPPNPVVE
jgi:signal transduction histidine kinase